MNKSNLESMVIDIPSEDVRLAEDCAEKLNLSLDEFMHRALLDELDIVVDFYSDIR